MIRFRALTTLLAAGALSLAFLVPPATAKAQGNNKDFAVWLDGVRKEALQQGISQATVDAALGKDLAPIPRVIELDRRQTEFTVTFERYLEITMPPARIEKGRQLMAQNKELLFQIQGRFGVQPQYLVALWGIESSFGEKQGTFPVVAALATLAYDGRRSAFFRKELFNALRILNEGHITPAEMRGSWAGAMGQNQFMPSSFVNNAIDFDGDGRRDIWGTPADVLASAANYLARSGWRPEQPWGVKVEVPANLDPALINPDATKPAAQWQALGIRRVDGQELPTQAGEGALIQPGGAGNPTFLVFDNFRAIMKWNKSTFFATAAGLLADQLAAQ